MYGDVVNSDKSAYFAEENVFFRSFETRVEVLMSKEKPKIIKIHTSSGVVMKVCLVPSICSFTLFILLIFNCAFIL